MINLKSSLKKLTKKVKAIKNIDPQTDLDNQDNTKYEKKVFDQPFYIDITEARLKHLKELNLPITGKTVIDLGCGVGRFLEFFNSQNCDIFCVDGREENIQELNNLYPGTNSAVVDLESQQILEHGSFQVAFCYGLLYHLSDPFGFLRNIYKICEEMMLIETCITDATKPVLHFVNENQGDESQALKGIGCRPSSSYVSTCLKLSGFEYIYTPLQLPQHSQFQFLKANDYSYLKKGRNIRDIFIASRKELISEKLLRI